LEFSATLDLVLGLLVNVLKFGSVEFLNSVGTMAYNK